MHAPLHDAEEGLILSFMGGETAPRPGGGVVHRFSDERLLSRIRGALIQLHDDVSPDELLDAHVLFGSPEDASAVIDALELNAVIGELHRISKAEHLEAPRICEHGPRVVHESVNTARFGHHVRARAQGQMVGVRQYHLSP